MRFIVLDRRRRGGRPGVLSCALLALLAAAPAAAQGVRGTATTTLRYLTLRPIQSDTVDAANVSAEDGQLVFDGHSVTCLAGGLQCVYYTPDDVAHAAVGTQDISATAWGFGVRGLSATFLLRGRADLGGDFTWPTSDDPFDAILAYAELQRSGYRVRAGRQRTLSGLGFSGYDGVDVLASPWRALRLEAYGGRSLARGLNDPASEALQGIEDFVRDQQAFLFGGAIEATPFAGTSLGLRYQREIWADRAGLLSERASLDFRSSLPGALSRVHLTGSVDYDFAFDRVGKARLSLRSPLPGDWGWVELTGRRYLPYFDLSTIWGFFSPTPYHEGEVGLTLRHWQPLTAWMSAGVREYGDPEISVIGSPISDRSVRYAVGARFRTGGVTTSGEYRLETGFGAVLNSGDAMLRWETGPRLALTVRGTAFQQIEEFRVGDNTVFGGGLGAELRLPGEARLTAGADVYRQAWDHRPSQADWNQLRAYSILSIPFGSDPGLRGPR